MHGHHPTVEDREIIAQMRAGCGEGQDPTGRLGERYPDGGPVHRPVLVRGNFTPFANCRSI